MILLASEILVVSYTPNEFPPGFTRGHRCECFNCLTIKHGILYIMSFWTIKTIFQSHVIVFRVILLWWTTFEKYTTYCDSEVLLLPSNSSSSSSFLRNLLIEKQDRKGEKNQRRLLRIFCLRVHVGWHTGKPAHLIHNGTFAAVKACDIRHSFSLYSIHLL